MSYDKQYYDSRKQELNQENLKNIVEAYQDIERVVIKVVNKSRDLQAKLQGILKQEEESIKKDGKTAKEKDPEKKTVR